MAIDFELNGQPTRVESVPGTPLLWVLRDVLALTGTKYACGMGLCGACTVHVDGEAVRSCTLPFEAAAGKRVVTIEGLRAADGGRHAVQRAWLDEAVVQCGYCQSGQILCAAALLARTPKPDDAAIDAAMSGVLCRCGTYQRVRAAIHRAAGN